MSPYDTLQQADCMPVSEYSCIEENLEICKDVTARMEPFSMEMQSSDITSTIGSSLQSISNAPEWFSDHYVPGISMIVPSGLPTLVFWDHPAILTGMSSVSHGSTQDHPSHAAVCIDETTDSYPIWSDCDLAWTDGKSVGDHCK